MTAALDLVEGRWAQVDNKHTNKCFLSTCVGALVSTGGARGTPLDIRILFRFGFGGFKWGDLYGLCPTLENPEIILHSGKISENAQGWLDTSKTCFKELFFMHSKNEIELPINVRVVNVVAEK